MASSNASEKCCIKRFLSIIASSSLLLSYNIVLLSSDTIKLLSLAARKEVLSAELKRIFFP
jgi:hypothetical protein